MALIMGDLKIRLNADGTSWSLLEQLKYHVDAPDSKKIIVVPKGFQIDFARVPRFARQFISRWKRTARAAVIFLRLWGLLLRENMGPEIRRRGYHRAYTACRLWPRYYVLWTRPRRQPLHPLPKRRHLPACSQRRVDSIASLHPDPAVARVVLHSYGLTVRARTRAAIL